MSSPFGSPTTLGEKTPARLAPARKRYGSAATTPPGGGTCVKVRPSSFEIASVVAAYQHSYADWLVTTQPGSPCSLPWYSSCTMPSTVVGETAYMAVSHSLSAKASGSARFGEA